jgi:hypothetical protein
MDQTLQWKDIIMYKSIAVGFSPKSGFQAEF